MDCAVNRPSSLIPEVKLIKEVLLFLQPYSSTLRAISNFQDSGMTLRYRALIGGTKI